MFYSIVMMNGAVLRGGACCCCHCWLKMTKNNQGLNLKTTNLSFNCLNCSQCRWSVCLGGGLGVFWLLCWDRCGQHQGVWAGAPETSDWAWQEAVRWTHFSFFGWGGVGDCSGRQLPEQTANINKYVFFDLSGPDWNVLFFSVYVPKMPTGCFHILLLKGEMAVHFPKIWDSNITWAS